ncbi:MAG: phosphoribosylanthranilate isomerase [Clostridia bacterium]|nr:phosphoribosylanthranilate isomerase [Clostridia bacterium]
MEIKICGLTRPEDIESVNAAGADYAGFIIGFPKSRRNLSPERAAALSAGLAAGIRSVGVFVDADPEVPAKLADTGAIDIIQLHGSEDEAYIERLKQRPGGTARTVWKAFQVAGPEDVQAACACSADMVILDSGQGSGRPFDWELLGGMTRPFLLAGGLDPGRISSVGGLEFLQGVDLSSGVETEGYKDRDKIRRAVAAARKE